MRSLSSTLLAEQKKSSYTPYIRVYLPNYSGGTDLTSYCKKGVHTEQVFGGGATLYLVDLSSWFFSGGAPIDLKGQQVNIGYGFITDAGKEYSEAGPLWVRNTRLISLKGVLAVQMECFDTWEKLGMIRAAGDDIADTAKVWNQDTTIYNIIGAVVSGIVSLTLDSSDGYVDSFQPYYLANINASVKDIIIDMIGLTRCGIKSRQDGLHIFRLPEQSGGANSYTYELGGDHTFFSCLEDDEIAVPNKIFVVDDIDVQTYKGTAIDTNSFGKLGYYVSRIYPIQGVSSNAEALQFAEAILSAIQRSVSEGIVIVPHNCGAELFDDVIVIDSRWPS